MNALVDFVYAIAIAVLGWLDASLSHENSKLRKELKQHERKHTMAKRMITLNLTESEAQTLHDGMNLATTVPGLEPEKLQALYRMADRISVAQLDAYKR